MAGIGGANLMSIFSDIVNTVGSINTHDKYAQQLTDIEKNLKVPASAIIAQNILKSLTNQGIAGIEGEKGDIASKGVVTLNNAKDFLTSGGMLDFLSKSTAMQMEEERKLNTENAQQEQANIEKYAGYMGTTMANFQQNLADKKTQLKADIAGVEADKSASIYKNLSDITGVVGGYVGKGMDDTKTAQTLKNATGSQLPIKDIINLMDLNDRFGGGGQSGGSNFMAQLMSTLGQKPQSQTAPTQQVPTQTSSIQTLLPQIFAQFNPKEKTPETQNNNWGEQGSNLDAFLKILQSTLPNQ